MGRKIPIPRITKRTSQTRPRRRPQKIRNHPPTPPKSQKQRKRRPRLHPKPTPHLHGKKIPVKPLIFPNFFNNFHCNLLIFLIFRS